MDAFALPVIVAWSLLFFPCPAANAQEAPDSATVLETRIAERRREAGFAEAIPIAEDLLRLRRADPRSKPYQVADAERLQATLELVAALPESARRELAAADGLKSEIDSLFAAGKLAPAVTAAERQLSIRRHHLGGEHSDVATSLWKLSFLLHVKGNYAEAESLSREALAMRRKLLGEEHPDVASSLNDLALLLHTEEDYAGAEPLFREALALRRRLLGEEHVDVAESLANMATLLFAKQDYAAAEPLFREALAMDRRLLGREHMETATIQNNLARLLRAKGDYTGAEPLLREALSTYRKVLGEEHLYVAAVLSNLAWLLVDKGDYVGAEPLFRERLELRRKIHGEEHPEVAWSLNHLADFLRYKGDYAAAEPLLYETLAMERKLGREGHPHFAWALNNLALLLSAKGDYAGAEPLFREALALKRKHSIQTMGDESTDIALVLTNLARTLSAEGHHESAEPLCREALGIRQRLLGEDHRVVAESFGLLAEILRDKGDYAHSESLLTRAAAIFDIARLRVGGDLSRATFQWSPYRSLALTRLALGKRDAAWEAAERSLGRVLADVLLTADKRSLTSVETAREDSLEQRLDQLERQLQTFLSAAGSDKTGDTSRRAEEVRTQLLSTQAEWGTFQHELAAQYPVSEGQAYPLDRIQATLSADEAIVSWLDADSLQARAGISSWGYVIRNEGPVRWHELAEPSSNVSPESFRLSLAQGFDPVTSSAEAEPIGDWMWRNRFDPLDDDLAGVRHLIVIPSGRMLGVPVEAITMTGNGELIGDRFAVSYMPSATISAWLSERSLVESETHYAMRGHDSGSRAGQMTAPRSRCLALGDPPFAAGDDDSQADCGGTIQVASTSRGAHSPFRVRGVGGAIAADNLTESALAGNAEVLTDLRRLPCTRGEAEAVGALFGEGATILVGTRASEQEMVRMATAGQLQQYRVLHLATHALVDDKRPERSALVLSQVGLPDKLEAALAGTRIYDGCLSAQEVVREWKLDADLVTLSACETALGKRVAGEGYIGLAHAFLQAGARSLLVSLWSVEDRSTSLLMQRFYENWLGRYEGVREMPPGGESRDRGTAMTKAEALQEAKHWLREYTTPNGRHPYSDPSYWAGFILIGQKD